MRRAPAIGGAEPTAAPRREGSHQMPVVERGSSSFIDVLDRVLDKGVVIDGWVVVASIQTYLRYAESLGLNPRIQNNWLPQASA